MITIEELDKDMKRAYRKALKKGDLAMAFKIKQSQMDFFKEMKRENPLDVSVMSEEELNQLLSSLIKATGLPGNNEGKMN